MEVLDTGTGIPPERLTELFQRFGHSEASLTREQEGTGLGLALVKELVELQKGTVGVQSEMGKGSVFWMEFPAAPEGTQAKLLSLDAGRSMAELELADGQVSVPRRPVTLKQRGPAGRHRLLIVEDNPDLRNFISGIFEEAGYTTITATNGEEGLRSAMLHRPDLIVTDLMMPKMSGIEMITAIRSRSGIKTVPVLLLTAKADLGTRREVTAAGADAYLPKPFNDEELLDVAANLLSLKTTEKSLMKELHHARLIQENLLPASLPEVPGIRLSAVYEPMELVGGDLYDFVELKNKTLGIFVADVSGHGIPAAMIASLAKVILTLFGPEQTSPCELLGYLNDQLYGKTAGNFLTAWYGIYNPETRGLIYATAGHPAPILERNREGVFQTSKGPALGWLNQAIMKDTTITLERGDRLYIYSDGLTEAANSKGIMFEDQGLVASILRMADLPLGVTVNQAVSDAREFQGGGVFQDDVTLVGMEVI
ncbi:MAG: SpoIIE family protein phosphatase [Spirochaetia bacterium]|nr:SpoIIE family protein phosphatase [Spirochaetia bacterium]